MGRFSGIAWTDHTFNGWIGCQKVSPGCQFCYAEHETFVRRERSHGRELWGPSGTRHKTSEDYWNQPIKWNRENWFECMACGWRGHLLAATRCPMCEVPGKLIPTRQRVFCMSLADVFEDRPELVPWRNELYNLIDATPNLDWLLLTKRIDLAGAQLPYLWLESTWPNNVWLGTSVENQEWAYKRIPELLRIPAKVRFLSIEPMLGPVDIRQSDGEWIGIHWVIVGGESGKKCRPFKADWARAVMRECRVANIPFFMKQLGGYPDKEDDIDRFQLDLRVREWPD